MKPNYKNFCTIVALSLAFSTPQLSAATYYWDGDGATTGFGTAGGTWASQSVTSGAGGWSTAVTGNTAVSATQTTTNADTFNFGTVANVLATGSITIGGTSGTPINVGSIIFEAGSGAITLSGGFISFGASKVVTVNNTTNTISSVIQGSNGFTKNSTGTLVLTGNNTYTGLTTVVNTGTLTLSGDNSAMSGGVTLSTATSQNPKLNINSPTAIGTGTLLFGGGGASDPVTINNTSGGAVALTTTNAMTLNRNFTFTGTNSLNLGNGTATLGGMTTGSSRSISVGASTLTLAGIVTETTPGTSNFGITLGGNGTLALTNAANAYTGKTVIGNNAGSSLRLQVSKLADLSAASSLGAPTTAALGLIQIGSASNSSTLELVGGTSASTTNRQIQIGSSANGSGNAIIQNNNTNAAHTLTFSNAAFNVAATGVSSSSRSIQLGGTNTGDNTISGTIIPNVGGAGTTGLVKNGTGTWVLNGTSSFTGAVSVQNGILKVNSIKNSGTNSAVGAGVTIALGTSTAGTLVYTGSGDSTNRPIRVGSATVGETGGGVINNDGSGPLTFSAAAFNSVAAGVTVARNLTLGGAYMGGINEIQGAVVNNDTGTGGIVSITKVGASTWQLSGTSTYTGATTVSGGILVLSAATSIQNSAFDTTSIAGDATNGLRTTVTTLTVGGLTGGNDFSTRFTSTTGGYTGLTALTLNPSSGVTHTYSANIGDGATGMNLTKTGAGTQILAATQSYTGTTTGSAGALIATTPAALPGFDAAGKVIFNGGTIGAQVGGAGWATADVDTLLSNAIKTSGALGIDTTNGNLVQWTPFTTNLGSLGLNKLGPNDLTLDQVNTYTGTTTVTAGTLTLANANALQNSLINISGGSVVLGGGITTLNLGGLSGSGTLDVTGLTNLTLNVPTGASYSYSGNIGEGATGMTLTKTGAGTQFLTGTNSYTGATQIDDGLLVFGNKAAKASGTASTAAAGSIGLVVHPTNPAFYLAAEIDALFNTNSLTGFNLNAASGITIDTTSAGGSFDQTVALTAARSLSKIGTGILVLSQVNSYSGSTSILAGTLSLTGSLTGGGAVSTSGSSDLTQSASGIISGASTFTQGSSGTSTLNGANSYTGATNVNLGQLIISHATALGTTEGNTVVASGGRLAMATASLSVAEPLTISGTGTTATNGALNFAGGASGMALTGPITLGGAALIQADGSTGSTLSGGISLGANQLSINTDGGATQTINTNAITGTGGSLVKSGSGTLVLGAENTYSGNTTVSAGTLTLADNAQLKFVLGATSGTSNSLTGAGTATLGGDFVIDTSAADALTTGTWTLENVTTATYGATFSVVGFVDAGDNKWTKDISSKRYTFDEATGVLTLAPAGNYASWANDPLKGNIPGALPADDFDNDGISNIVEYALGMNPRVSTQPAGVLSGNLIITYTKGADAIANGDVSWVIETSQTLADGSWTAQVTQPAADPALTISYTFTPGSPVKNFARLKVIQVP